MKTLADLKSECAAAGLPVGARPGKAGLVAALRDHRWREQHPDQPHPPQVHPMLLADWSDLAPEEARRVEEGPGWVVQPKLDGVRALLHVEGGRVRVTSRCVSEVTHRLGEFQDNLPHLAEGLSGLEGAILDGELVFPGATLDTGRAIARHPLQAATAILATGPGRARLLQDRPERRIRFHAFDVLKSRGVDVTPLPLRDRLDHLARAIDAADNPHLELVPNYCIGRPAIHRCILEAGGEGTVWKDLDRPYEPGRRVRHWIKRKREMTVEAFVSGSKPGTPGRGHEGLVGALEFSARQADGSIRAVAWVSAWGDAERREMTRTGPDGTPRLAPAYLDRPALVAGQDESARSGRLRHARLRRWLD